MEPDQDRCVLHFDVASFYCSVEEQRDPSLKGVPFAVTQKHICVTASYAARQGFGVGKLMGVAEARRRCPGLVLVPGEDLTPYRAASRAIASVLQRYGAAERLGMDEVFLDVTEEAGRRAAAAAAAAAAGAAPRPWQGHLHSASTAVVQESRHRVMDLRVAGRPQHQPAASTPVGPPPGPRPAWEPLLKAGAEIAAEARAAVKADCGFVCSAGIAGNKLLAKLCSGLHKPDDQTVLPPPEAAAFVAPLPVRALPGVGQRLEAELAAIGIAVTAQLRAVPKAELARRFGERRAAFLHAAAHGKDPTPVQASGRAKSVTVEDSFRSCLGLAAAESVLRVLGPDLLARLREEAEGEGRWPATLTLKWRRRGEGYSRSSASAPMPAAALDARRPDAARAAALAAAAVELLGRKVAEPFDLTLLSIGATNFSGTAPAAAGRSIAEMLGGRRAAAAPAAAAGAEAEAPPGTALAAPQQTQTQTQTQQQPAQQQAGAEALSSRQAAAASARFRRDYGDGVPAHGALLLSKRQEREAREQGGQGAQASALPPQHQHPGPEQLHSAGWGGRCGSGEEEGGSGAEEEACVWDDLRAMAGSRSGAKRQRAAAAENGGGSGWVASREQQQERDLRRQQDEPPPPPPQPQQPQQQQRQQQQQQQQSVREAAAAAPAVRPPPPPPPAAARQRVSYRNDEARALLRGFAAGRGVGGQPAFDPGREDLPPEERSSLELAWTLQQAELRAAAAQKGGGGGGGGVTVQSAPRGGRAKGAASGQGILAFLKRGAPEQPSADRPGG